MLFYLAEWPGSDIHLDFFKFPRSYVLNRGSLISIIDQFNDLNVSSLLGLNKLDVHGMGVGFIGEARLENVMLYLNLALSQ